MSIQTPYIELTSLDIDNHIINGDMRFNQRFAGSNFAANTASPFGQFVTDRVEIITSGSTVKNILSGRSNSVPSLLQGNYNFPYSYVFEAVTGVPLSDPNDAVIPFSYKIEGFDYRRLAGKTVTISFWFYSNVAGVFPISFNSFDFQRSYVSTFTVNQSNTWEFKTITLTFESVNLGNYNFDNTNFGIQMSIATAAGTDHQTAILNQWQSSPSFTFYNTASTVNIMGTSSNFFNITGVKMNLGPNPAPFTLAGRNYTQELSLCQRYYEKSYQLDVAPGTAGQEGGIVLVGLNAYGNNRPFFQTIFQTTKRVVPSLHAYSPATGTIDAGRDDSGGADFNCSSLGHQSEKEAQFFYNGTSTNGNQLRILWTAESEL